MGYGSLFIMFITYIYYIVNWVLLGFPKSITFIRFLSPGRYTMSSLLLYAFSAVLSRMASPWSYHTFNTFYIFFIAWNLCSCTESFQFSPQWKFTDGWEHTEYSLYSLPSQCFFLQRILGCPIRTKFILSGWKTVYIHFKDFLPV